MINSRTKVLKNFSGKLFTSKCQLPLQVFVHATILDSREWLRVGEHKISIGKSYTRSLVSAVRGCDWNKKRGCQTIFLDDESPVPTNI